MLECQVSNPHIAKQIGIIRAIKKPELHSKCTHNQIVIPEAGILYLRKFVLAKNKPGTVKQADRERKMSGLKEKHFCFHHVIGVHVHTFFFPSHTYT